MSLQKSCIYPAVNRCHGPFVPLFMGGRYTGRLFTPMIVPEFRTDFTVLLYVKHLQFLSCSTDRNIGARLIILVL